jgi:NAD(P)-dependent dehydrogenase (short-subunit alcohol dehydrogenase family)
MFKGSRVLLTGVGAEGQAGEVVAGAFAAAGASVILVDRTSTHVDARTKAIRDAGNEAHGYACDLTNSAAVAGLAKTIRNDHGPSLHALVHMAGGFGMSGPVAESTDDVWNRQLAINLTTAYVTARAFLPL